jgi:hypothetical protein
MELIKKGEIGIMAKGGLPKKKKPARRITAAQVLFILISVIVILSFSLSLIAK